MRGRNRDRRGGLSDGPDPLAKPGALRRAGQSLVEFALIVPVFLLLLLAMLDFGFAFYTNLTLEYASREGARVGAALAAGNGTVLPCGQVDDHVVAAVQRVLESAGIPVQIDPSDASKGGVNWIHIYKADANGNGWTSNYNEWTYNAGGGPNVDGAALDFKGPTSPAWSACGRQNGATPDSIGVAINYTYAWRTPIGSVFRLVGSHGPFFSNLVMLDRTSMNLNPTYP